MAEVRHAWIDTSSTPQAYVFMAWYFIKPRKNVTLGKQVLGWELD
jgi:hypothetical protein